MKIIVNSNIRVTETIHAPAFDNSRVARTGYARLVRIVTNEPVPQQTSYTGKIELK